MSEIPKDFVDLKKKSFKELVREKLIAEDQKATIGMYPFCFRCARLDLEDKFKKVHEEYERTGVMENKVFDIDKIDLAPYKDKARFNKVTEKEALDTVRSGLGSKQVLIGHHHSYVCKERGCGRDIFVPLKEKKVE